jgi:bacterioferritin (cytochrome b1)
MEDQILAILTTGDILAGLNKALLAERQAVEDYGAHARASEQPAIGEALETLCDVEREHALRLALRITALGGSPASQATKPQSGGDTLADMLSLDLWGEQWAIVHYAQLVAGVADDEETADLMTELLMDEIRHARWLKSTLRALGTKE